MALLLGLLAALTTLAQDEAEQARISRTTWHSAAVPGWGQINNGKWWKVPIVYGALGVSAHFIQTEGSLYKGYRDGYLAMTDGDPTTIYVTPFDESGVRERRDFHRANLEQSVLTLVLIWGAQSWMPMWMLTCLVLMFRRTWATCLGWAPPWEFD